jgi:hypothetical protein
MYNNDEDHSIVKTYLELPYVLRIVEMYIRKLESSNMKLSYVFVLYLKGLQSEVFTQINDTKRVMRNRGIKIIQEDETEDSLMARYKCRGYEHPISLLWGKVRSDTEVKLAELMGVDITKMER